jgi:hypothetical protein
MGETLENSVDSKDVATSQALNNTMPLMTTVFVMTHYNSSKALPPHSDDNVIYFPAALSKSIDESNLGVKLVKKKFEGFLGLAKVVYSDTKRIKQNFMLPHIYDHPTYVSIDELLKITPDNVIDLKYYYLNPDLDAWRDTFYGDFGRDLLQWGACDAGEASKCAFAVAEALRTQKNIPIPEGEPVKMYTLLTKSKEIYLLHCSERNHNHLLKD